MMKQKPESFALMLILCLLIQMSIQATFPQSVINQMATRQSRYHHFLWHNVRENWNRFDSNTQAAFTKIGWKPPHPARTYDSNGNAYAIPDNLSGEDFLYMHRQMIAEVNSIISQNNDPYGKIKGWTSFPAPGDKDYPVPSSYTIPGNSGQTNTVKNWKASSFYTNNIKPMEATLKDPVQLRKMTLGQLGSKIEVTVHSYAHLRWSTSSSYGYRNGYKGTIPNVDKKWDDPRYNWLVDTYSSHVNPIFWKIHGWVDDRIEDWRRANGLSSIRWRGTWTGGPMSSLDSVMKELMIMDDTENTNDNSVGDVLQQAMDILMKSGVPDSSPADLVNFSSVPEKPTTIKKPRVCKSRRSSKKNSR